MTSYNTLLLPSEKAHELVLLYADIIGGVDKDKHYDKIDINNAAKESALLTVWAILASHYRRYKGYGEQWDYWQEVREAINAM